MKKAISIILVFLMIVLFTACEHIEDSNGDDTSLAVLTMDDLLGKSISYRGSGGSTSTVRKNITTVGQYEDYDIDVLTMKGGFTSGIKNIMVTELKAGDKFTIESDAGVEKGNLGIILMSPDNELLHSFSTNGTDSITITAETKGFYIVRMGAESFTGNIQLKRFIN